VNGRQIVEKLGRFVPANGITREIGAVTRLSKLLLGAEIEEEKD
jgi:hypothetical protein